MLGNDQAIRGPPVDRLFRQTQLDTRFNSLEVSNERNEAWRAICFNL